MAVETAMTTALPGAHRLRVSLPSPMQWQRETVLQLQLQLMLLLTTLSEMLSE